MPSKTKQLVAFRLDQDIVNELRSPKYSKHKGKLARMLFKAFFNNRLPLSKSMFEKELEGK